MSDRWVDRLSEFLDGQLSPRESVELEWHLESCLVCRRTLAELREVKARAQQLDDEPPTRDLWPSIAARLEQAPQVDLTSLQVIDLKSPRPVRRAWRVSLTLPQLAAAAVVLMLLTGSAVWLVLSRTDTGPALASGPEVVRPVSSAGQPADDYASAIQSLEQALQQQRARLDPVTVAILEENLRQIDTAITEAQAALRTDPGSLYLNQHLENTMKKKIQLLRRATRLPGARS